MSKPTLNIGLIGSGFMGQAHADAFRRARMLYPNLPMAPHLYCLADANDVLAAKAPSPLDIPNPPMPPASLLPRDPKRRRGGESRRALRLRDLDRRLAQADQ